MKQITSLRKHVTVVETRPTFRRYSCHRHWVGNKVQNWIELNKAYINLPILLPTSCTVKTRRKHQSAYLLLNSNSSDFSQVLNIFLPWMVFIVRDLNKISWRKFSTWRGFFGKIHKQTTLRKASTNQRQTKNVPRLTLQPIEVYVRSLVLAF